MASRRLILRLLLIGSILFSALSAAGPRLPWPRRFFRDVESVHITAYKNTPLSLWPAEPRSPLETAPDRFVEAVRRLCGQNGSRMRPKLPSQISLAAVEFGVDPFLLAALVYDGSGCRPGTTKWDAARGRFGPTRLPLDMHRRHIKNGFYHYYTGAPGAFEAHTLDVSRYPFRESTVRAAASNLYFAAAILAVFKAQAPDLRRLYPGAPYRHFVSHFFYGDRPRGAEPEARVLAARRRLIGYYLAVPADRKIGAYREFPLSFPLDGAPRLLLDYFGNRRGKPRGMGHRGIDIEAAEGEPVRAVADGTVVFSGVDEPGGGNHRLLTPTEAASLTPDEMGPGGLFVAINHGNDFGTIYMHLSAISVSYSREVKRGEIIGYAGRTGAEKSGPHLHLEFRRETDRVDPALFLAPALVNPYAADMPDSR